MTLKLQRDVTLQRSNKDLYINARRAWATYDCTGNKVVQGCAEFLHNTVVVESKAPVSQLVNADDTSVIEIKTQHYLES